MTSFGVLCSDRALVISEVEYTGVLFIFYFSLLKDIDTLCHQRFTKVISTGQDISLLMAAHFPVLFSNK